MKESRLNPFMDPERIKKLKNLALRSIKGFGDRKLLDRVFSASVPEKESKLRFSGREVHQGETITLKIEVENLLFVILNFYPLD